MAKTECITNTKREGWVIINIGHPNTGKSYVVEDTFSFKRTSAIKKFIEGSGSSWRYWYDRYNFRSVRATQSISITR